MKRTLFLASHFGSGYEFLYEILNSHPVIQGFQVHQAFDHPSQILDFVAQAKHKNDTTLAVYMTPILSNFSISHKKICEMGKFVYLIRPPLHTLNTLVNGGNFTPTHALDYYLFRLRRLAQMSKMTGGVLLTCDNLEKNEGWELVQKYLKLKTPIEGRAFQPAEINSQLHWSYVDKAQKAYEKTYRFMKNQLVN